ncbi:MAG TPA: hypothetical protein GXX49_10815 [Clostridiaceae bacterium]|nr:hypothetical protein [Clostridiaceae bacterium]
MSFVILLCGLRNLIRRQEAELDKIYRTMPIHVEVSDIKGKRDNLFIRDYYIDFFASEKYELAAYLKDICLKRTLIITELLAHEENIYVIVVTHDISVSEQADIVIKMTDGKFIEEKTAYN